MAGGQISEEMPGWPLATLSVTLACEGTGLAKYPKSSDYALVLAFEVCVQLDVLVSRSQDGPLEFYVHLDSR